MSGWAEWNRLRALEGRALRLAREDERARGPGLLTVPRLRGLYAAGEVGLPELERGVEVALRREAARAPSCRRACATS